MWPWSAIKEARADAEKFALRCGTLTTQLERTRQEWVKLNESYEVVCAEKASIVRLHEEAKVYFDQQNDTVARQAIQIETLNTEKQVAIRRAIGLQAQLAEASKNDARDAKGRFVKSVAQPGVTTMGKSSGELGS